VLQPLCACSLRCVYQCACAIITRVTTLRNSRQQRSLALETAGEDDTTTSHTLTLSSHLTFTSSLSRVTTRACSLSCGRYSGVWYFVVVVGKCVWSSVWRCNTSPDHLVLVPKYLLRISVMCFSYPSTAVYLTP